MDPSDSPRVRTSIQGSRANETVSEEASPVKQYSITDTGLILGLTYHRVRDLAMRGVLAARRDERGRLVVSADSIDDYQRQRAASTGGVDARQEQP
jgi:hypothetical protein